LRCVYFVCPQEYLIKKPSVPIKRGVTVILIIIVIIIIITYLTANWLSPGGSGYNACT